MELEEYLADIDRVREHYSRPIPPSGGHIGISLPDAAVIVKDFRTLQLMAEELSGGCDEDCAIVEGP